jgi:DNA replication protein DnaC
MSRPGRPVDRDEAVCGRIDAHLQALRMPGALGRYRDLLAEFGLDHHALDLLDGILAAETDSRELHRYQRNLRSARFPVVKELSGFDFAAIPALSKDRVDELATGRFIVAHEAVILVGNPGTGKTHLLIALGMEAIRAGYRVRFVTAAALVNELLLARAELRVPKLLRQYAAFDLVLLDELGYVPFSQEAAQLLFAFFAERYETRATALTTNLPFAQWPQVFGDQTMTVALLDRLTHRSHVLLLNGDSYRLRDSRRRVGITPPHPISKLGEPPGPLLDDHTGPHLA